MCRPSSWAAPAFIIASSALLGLGDRPARSETLSIDENSPLVLPRNPGGSSPALIFGWMPLIDGRSILPSKTIAVAERFTKGRCAISWATCAS